MTRVFFRDLQEWEWIPTPVRRRHRPAHPAQHQRAARPGSRVIADGIWAKLMWAGLNLTPSDRPPATPRSPPMELLRRDHAHLAVRRQRRTRSPGCAWAAFRWQHDGMPISRRLR